MVTELTESTFDSFIESNNVAVIDCWAPWCGPCKRMIPIMDEISNELQGKAGVGKLNVDENEAISARFRISAIPTILIFKDKVLVNTMVGLQPKDNIVEYVNSL